MSAFVLRIRNVVRNRRGSVSIELAFVLPLMLSLLTGGVELINYVLIHQKLDRVSTTLADLVSQSTRMTEGLMQGLFLLVDSVMQPYDLTTDGVALVSSVSAHNGGAASIDWQRSTGSGDQASTLGQEGDAASLPGGLVLHDGDNVIICEAWYVYEPVLLHGVIPETTLYRSAVYRPRFGKLDVIYP